MGFAHIDLGAVQRCRSCRSLILVGRFIRSRRNHVVIDAARPLDQVISDVERAVTEALVGRDASRG